MGRPTMHFSLPQALSSAVKLAADRKMTSISNWVRQAMIDQLRAEGVDLAVPPVAPAAPVDDEVAKLGRLLAQMGSSA